MNAQNDNAPIAEAINKLLDLNKTIPYENRIRVISISWGYDTDKEVSGNDKLLAAYNRAKEEEILVLTTSIFSREDKAFFGLKKIPLSDTQMILIPIRIMFIPWKTSPTA